jgi:hypothetical protein
MKFFLSLMCFVLTGLSLRGQTINEPMEGTVTFISSQNVYVKFKSTGNIAIGDTLSIYKDDKYIPALKVKYLSSSSCACIPLSEIKLNLSDKVICKPKPVQVNQTEEIPVQKTDTGKPPQKDTLRAEKTEKTTSLQQIRGYLSVASYSMFNSSIGNSERMQYTLSLNARNLGNSKLSVETYVTFYHKFKHESEITNNIFSALKIYNLAVSYEFNKVNVLVGRKINPMISNMGAVDGLQMGIKFRPIYVGILAGSRPDYKDYSFNFSLLQFGAYLYNEVSTKNGPVQSTLGFIEQTNSGKTDRRFVYLQHSNSLIRNVNFYGTAEIDLYNKTKAPQDTSQVQDTTYKVNNIPKFSNLYFSLRYRASGKLNLSLSYSARQNIIYYETYKSYVDKLLQNETRQGYFLQANYRPTNTLSVGTTIGYNFRKSDPQASRNLNIYLNYFQVPVLGVSTTLSATLLESSYISGKIYRLDISRDIIPGRLFGGINYSYVDYRYYNSEYALPQNIGEINLIWKIYKKLSLSVFYEGTFDKQSHYNRLYAQISQRF